MKYKIFFSGLLTFLSFNSLIAQQSKTLTMAEAIELSLKYNKQIKINESKILGAIAAEKEAEEKRLPEAGINTSYMYLPITPTIDFKNSSSSSGNNKNKVSQIAYGMLSVSLPVYSGGKIKYGVESAKILEKAVKIDALNDRAEVVMNTINGCINLFKSYEAISLFKAALEQAKQRVNDFSNLEKNGLLARNDLLKAQLQASNIELTLLDAQSNYNMACVNMNLMIGLPEQTILIPDKKGIALPDSVQSIAAYEQAALKSRNEIKSISLRKDAAALQIKSIKSEYFPAIALSGGYIAADIPNFLTIVNAVNIGIGIKYNFSSFWKTKTKVKEAEAGIQQIQLSKEILLDNIVLQINQAYQNYIVSRKKIEVHLSAVVQATENDRIIKNKYDNSLATTTELLEADVALLKANLSVTDAKADSFLDYNKLLYAAGILNN